MQRFWEENEPIYLLLHTKNFLCVPFKFPFRLLWFQNNDYDSLISSKGPNKAEGFLIYRQEGVKLGKYTDKIMPNKHKNEQY